MRAHQRALQLGPQLGGGCGGSRARRTRGDAVRRCGRRGERLHHGADRSTAATASPELDAGAVPGDRERPRRGRPGRCRPSRGAAGSVSWPIPPPGARGDQRRAPGRLGSETRLAGSAEPAAVARRPEGPLVAPAGEVALPVPTFATSVHALGHEVPRQRYLLCVSVSSVLVRRRSRSTTYPPCRSSPPGRRPVDRGPAGVERQLTPWSRARREPQRRRPPACPWSP